MFRTRIKIDGICRPEDAAAATRAGVDAIGVVLDPTAGRFVSLEDARKIIAAVGPMVTTLGVFVNSSDVEIQRAVETLPLGVVQLHGDETPEFVASLKPMRIIKALNLGLGDSAFLQQWREAVRELQLSNLIGLIVESARPSGPRGGSGIASDFAVIADMQSRGFFAGLPPLIVAGGLTPENVGEAVRRVRPFAVDVSSGVESVRREKSVQKIESFVQAVRQADEK